MTRRAARAIGRTTTRSGLALLAVALLMAPFSVAWHRYVLGREVSTQHTVATIAPSAVTTAGWQATATGLATDAPPVVLAYHDIRPSAAGAQTVVTAGDASRYVVTPQALDAQLTALERAGYRSMTADQYVSYLRGGPAGPRSVLITFDDGTHGLWTYADRILARHGMHGVAFVITGRVGTRRPYYLSWPEIGRMAASGRWDIESHTRNLHSRVQIDAAGHTASAVTHRMWLPAERRVETMAEFQRRLTTDLSGSVADIRSHHLPTPRLFAYPFSEMYEQTGDQAAADLARATVSRTFVAAFNNRTPTPLPTSRRAAARQLVGRAEVLATTTPEALLDRVEATTAVAPAGPVSARPDLWTNTNGVATSVAVSPADGTVRLGASSPWTSVAYAQQASADWIDYVTDATLRGLAAQGVESASVNVRTGSTDPVTVRVSRSWLQIARGDGPRSVVLAQGPLLERDAHQLRIIVLAGRTVVSVDGGTAITFASTTGPDGTGGIGLAARRTNATARWPVFGSLTVRPTAGAASY